MLSRIGFGFNTIELPVIKYILCIIKRKYLYVEGNIVSNGLIKALKSGGSKVLDKKNVG